MEFLGGVAENLGGRETETAEILRPPKSAAGPLRALKVQDATGLAAEVLRTGDFAFVLTFAGSGSLVSPLTSDLGRIEKALHSAFNAQPPLGPAGTSLYDAMFWACTEELSAQSGLKALIIFSDMLDNSSNHTYEEAPAQAQRSGVAIYAIILGETGSRGLQSRVERFAKLLADRTGGVCITIHKPDHLKETLRDIRADLDNTYVIAYKPKTHGPASVKVRCTRKGVKIIAPDQRY